MAPFGLGLTCLSAARELSVNGTIKPALGNGVVVAVARSGTHSFSKRPCDAIRLVAGLGVEGDAHLGSTVKHQSRVRRDPTMLNLRQVHLIQAELFEELRGQGFAISPGNIGENVTTRGIDLLALPAGSRLRLGVAALIEITGLRNPCVQLDRFMPGLMAATLDRDVDGTVIRKAGVMAIVLAAVRSAPATSSRSTCRLTLVTRSRPYSAGAVGNIARVANRTKRSLKIFAPRVTERRRIRELNDFVPCRSDCSLYEIPTLATVTPTGGSRERTMFPSFRNFFHRCGGFADHGSGACRRGSEDRNLEIGTRVWLRLRRPIRPIGMSSTEVVRGAQLRCRGYQDHRGGYSGYSRRPHGHTYGYNHHAPGW